MYQQIVDGIKESVAKGLLRAGDKLPSVRELSMTLTLNHNTVAKAYQELERERVIEVVRGRGTFVGEGVLPPDREERLRELRGALERLLVEAHHLQVGEAEFLALVHDVLVSWRRQKEVGP
ncbi:MAG: GntR family transcriptional regulator [Alicyclobacillus sp.]|nr:GntR family transcriptional regulator [Alicyclobacillus sp.]